MHGLYYSTETEVAVQLSFRADPIVFFPQNSWMAYLEKAKLHFLSESSFYPVLQRHAQLLKLQSW